jgi:sigma-B regulation protein RsbU (phosphoserine phosphatase)
MPGILDYLSEKYQTENILEINQRLLELSSLFEISQILNSSLELHSVLNNILLIPMGRLMISQGAILLKSDDCFTPKLWKGVLEDIEKFQFKRDEVPDSIYLWSAGGKRLKRFFRYVDFGNQQKFSISVPIKSRDELIGAAIYGAKLNKQPFSEADQDFLSSLANLSSTAIENALKVNEIQQINLQLDERIQQLKTLFDIAQGLSATLDSEKIVKLLTYAFMVQMLVNRYAIVIYAPEGLHKLECKGLNQEELEGILWTNESFFQMEDAVILKNLKQSKIKNQLLKIGVRVIIPMRHQNKILGFILLGEKINRQDYLELDLEFLTTLVSQAIVSLENARLFQETLEKQKIEQELQVAKSIQRKLLPREIISLKNYDIWGINKSSKEVGGDYFDVIPISKDLCAVAIADVSGKSVPAALIMANLQAGLRTLISEEMPLAQVVKKLNNLIHQNTDLDKYITFFIGVLDTRTHQFTYVNAGHNPPFLCRNSGELELLEVGGIILGMMPDFNYETGNIRFKRGDILLCYTDGVNEAMNSEDEEFGDHKLKKVLQDSLKLKAKSISEAIIHSVEDFTTGMPQYDDITLLITKRI